MTEQTRWMTVLLVLGFAVAGCNKSEEEPKDQAAQATLSANPEQMPAAQEAPEPQEAEVEDQAISTEEDFEEVAAQAITEDNLEQELDRLSKEIEAE